MLLIEETEEVCKDNKTTANKMRKELQTVRLAAAQLGAPNTFCHLSIVLHVEKKEKLTISKDKFLGFLDTAL